MDEQGKDIMTDATELAWAALESSVEALIERNLKLSQENEALRQQQQNLTAERATLIEKNELAKSRVEAMIGRLKGLEQD